MDLHFENEPTLKAAFAGSAYEANPVLLRQDFGLHATQNLIKGNQSNAIAGTSYSSRLPTILFAPHIDFRVEKKLYQKAFKSLPNKKFRRVLVIGTSHYAGYFPDTYENTPFIASKKDFHSPLGLIKSAEDWVEKLANQSCVENIGLSFQDRAFMPEHSIEFHLVLAQLFLEPDFDFFPILVGSLEDMMYTDQSEQAQQLTKLAKSLTQLIFDYPNPEEILILVSGDLAHVGPRFGDEEDAKDHFLNILKYDQKFLKHITTANYEALLKQMRADYDCYNHCGFPPALLMLKILGENHWKLGTVIGREQWYEEEDQSMVSYGAVLLNS